MYENHWQLNEKPFEDKTSSAFYYPSSTHQTALLKIRYQIENRREIVALCGGSGVGKSLIHQQLRSQLPDFVADILTIPYPDLEREQLLAYLALQIAPEVAASSLDTAIAIHSIEKMLRQRCEERRHVLLLIEEAEWLEARGGFEVLRLLLNLARHPNDGTSSLTILMNGQPSLLAQLDRHTTLNQRVAAKCIVHRFTDEETSAYVSHRLRAAGGVADNIFTPQSLDSIHVFTEGIPRRINSLCDMALMVGYAQDLTRIYPSLIEEVYRDLSPVASL